MLYEVITTSKGQMVIVNSLGSYTIVRERMKGFTMTVLKVKFFTKNYKHKCNDPQVKLFINKPFITKCLVIIRFICFVITSYSIHYTKLYDVY